MSRTHSPWLPNVIMNRIKNKEFPDTVTEVVWRIPMVFHQFSPTYDGRINEVTVTDETREAVRLFEGGLFRQGTVLSNLKLKRKPECLWFERSEKTV